jgi:hypothetical protein
VRLLAAAAAVGALALAGCGKHNSGGGGVVPAGAGKAPADAPGFIALDTTGSSWNDALKVARRFPAFTDAVDQRELARVKSAVGPEVDLVWLDFANNGDDVVALTKPSTLAKLKMAIGSSDVAFADLSDGWFAFGSTRALVDRFKSRADGSKLDGVGEFKDGFAQLDKDAAVRAWVQGSVVQAALDRSLQSGGAAPRVTHDAGDLKAIAGQAKAAGDGVALELDGLIDPAPDPATFKPSLPRDVPAGALLYVSATHLEDPVRLILRMVGDSVPNFETRLQQVQGVTGLRLEDDVYPLLHGESGLAVYRGGRIPPILFLQKVDDEQKADSLLRRITALARLSGEVRVGSATFAGTTVEKLTFTGGVTVYDGVARGKLFVTNAVELARQAVGGAKSSLADDNRFGAARKAAKLPDKVAAFWYGDLASGLPYIFSVAGSGVPPATRANTKPLRHALLYLVRDGDALRLSGFTTIK